MCQEPPEVTAVDVLVAGAAVVVAGAAVVLAGAGVVVGGAGDAAVPCALEVAVEPRVEVRDGVERPVRDGVERPGFTSALEALEALEARCAEWPGKDRAAVVPTIPAPRSETAVSACLARRRRRIAASRRRTAGSRIGRGTELASAARINDR